MKIIILIACVSKKRPFKSKAKDLYISTLFTKSLAYAHTLNPDKIYIISALHHLLDLEQEKSAPHLGGNEAAVHESPSE